MAFSWTAGSERWRSYLATVGHLDPRSLALFRIAVGACLALDVLFFKFPATHDLYGPDGHFAEFHREIATSGPAFLSLFHWLGSDLAIQCYWALCFVAFLSFTVGFLPRLSGALSVFLVGWTRAGNGLLFLGPDDVLQALLLFTVFLPSNGRYSVTTRRPAVGGLMALLPSIAVLLFASMIYLNNGWSKAGGNWLSGEALFGVLQSPIRGPWAPWMLSHPSLILPGSWVTVAYEVGAIFLIFSPWKVGLCRLVAAGAIVFFHVGMLPFVNPGYYWAVTGCVATLLMPGFVWDWLEKWTGWRWLAAGTGPPPPAETPGRRARFWGGVGAVVPLLIGVVVFYNAMHALSWNPFAKERPVGQPVVQAVYGALDPWLGAWFPLFRGWFRFYPQTLLPSPQNVLVSGTLADSGERHFLFTGLPDAPGREAEALAAPSVDFRRPYYRMHQLTYFGSDRVFRAHRVYRRWLTDVVARWHARGGAALTSAEMVYLRTLPAGTRAGEIERRVLARWRADWE